MSVVLTGATGSVGSHLAHRLIHRGCSVILVGRGPDFESRAKQKIQSWGQVSNWDRVKFQGWDAVLSEGAGPSSSPSHLIHAAADTNLSPQASKNQVGVNLALLEKALALCERWRIPRIDFLSSAYGCGQREGCVREERHPEPSCFRNPYEESKWRCEERLFDFGKAYPSRRVIHRPSLILPPVEYAKKNTPRAFVRIFEKLRFLSSKMRGENLRVTIPSSSRIGFVALTGFARDFLEILECDFEEGTEVFHYTSREVPALGEWVSWVRESVPGLCVEIRETCGLGRRVLGELEPYLRNDFCFDQSNLERRLQKSPASQARLTDSFFQALIGRLLEPSKPASLHPTEVHG